MYHNPKVDLENEIIQLVYYGKLDYFAAKSFNFYQRQQWLTEIKKILESERPSVPGTEVLG